jgi:hypothetical protein
MPIGKQVTIYQMTQYKTPEDLNLLIFKVCCLMLLSNVKIKALVMDG